MCVSIGASYMSKLIDTIQSLLKYPPGETKNKAILSLYQEYHIACTANRSRYVIPVNINSYYPVHECACRVR